MKDHVREEYEGRINRVLDYIGAHLDAKLELEALARIAAFSPFHFHRIFSAMVGEPLSGYVRRIRLERAAMRLASNPRLSVTEIALDHGFTSPSTFARAFKDHFGISASAWREQRGHLECSREERSKNGKAVSKDCQADSNPTNVVDLPEGYRPLQTALGALPNERTIDMQIEAKVLPARHVAYARAMGSYDQAAQAAWGELFQWAGPRGLLGNRATMLGVSHDDPTLTEGNRLRYDACIEVEPEVRAERNITITEIPGGKYAVAHFDGPGDAIQAAYDQIYGQWMPKSGYQPGDSPCYEVYLNDPHKEGKFVMDICVPIKPL